MKSLGFKIKSDKSLYYEKIETLKKVEDPNNKKYKPVNIIK